MAGSASCEFVEELADFPEVTGLPTRLPPLAPQFPRALPISLVYNRFPPRPNRSIEEFQTLLSETKDEVVNSLLVHTYRPVFIQRLRNIDGFMFYHERIEQPKIAIARR